MACRNSSFPFFPRTFPHLGSRDILVCVQAVAGGWLREWRGHSMKLATKFHLVPRLRMRGAISSVRGCFCRRRHAPFCIRSVCLFYSKFQVSTALLLWVLVFWNVTVGSGVNRRRRFERTYGIHLRYIYIIKTAFWQNWMLINLLKPTGHVMHRQFNIQQLYALSTLYLCVLYLSENKQRLVPLTA